MIRKLIHRVSRRVETSKYPNLVIDTAFMVHGNPSSILLVKAVNKPGVLSRVSKIISDEGINILKVSTMEPLNGAGYMMLLLDNCDGECAERISDKIRKNMVGEVEEVIASSSEDSYVFLRYGSLYFLDKSSIIITTDMLGSIMDELVKTYSLSTVKNVLRKIGQGIGRAIYEKLVFNTLREEGGWDRELDKALAYLADFYKALGYGSMRVEKLSGIRYRITVEDNFECVSLRKYSLTGKTGHVSSGVITGYLTALLNRRVVVYEKECINSGGKRCVFEVEVYEGLSNET